MLSCEVCSAASVRTMSIKDAYDELVVIQWQDHMNVLPGLSWCPWLLAAQCLTTNIELQVSVPGCGLGASASSLSRYSLLHLLGHCLAAVRTAGNEWHPVQRCVDGTGGTSWVGCAGVRFTAHGGIGRAYLLLLFCCCPHPFFAATPFSGRSATGLFPPLLRTCAILLFNMASPAFLRLPCLGVSSETLTKAHKLLEEGHDGHSILD
mmetsp:Transcript_30088/g.70146  ORF Transcript_30088/g.70146 Transcript_30088/m.70146 type:complete len:207 (+) Transcript_30088:971-1591(+)